MQTHMGKQQGFTLIEIAIVLVIIGLLLGGVLKGQEMIENAKAKNAVTDFNGVVAAVNAYRDRYRQLPGDDGPTATLTARGTAWTGLTGNANPNGVIATAATNPFAAGANETLWAWQHLRASGLITGNATTAGVAALPKNAFGGQTGIGSGYFGLPGSVVVCMNNVPGKAAGAIDTQLDDGNPTTGSIISLGTNANLPTAVPTGANAPAVSTTAVYNEGFAYTVCRAS
ncbi:prepilin-type N-terminal cleavage/methylation domain-containing protein [Chitinimonas sp.]|uniref:prepilin-type N-terminal cleavage/methylation domain-containing protein n=1 Tax=Chitinimonas sp. TaxID=1934313 RepID=UPI0035AE7810